MTYRVRVNTHASCMCNVLPSVMVILVAVDKTTHFHVLFPYFTKILPFQSLQLICLYSVMPRHLDTHTHTCTDQPTHRQALKHGEDCHHLLSSSWPWSIILSPSNEIFHLRGVDLPLVGTRTLILLQVKMDLNSAVQAIAHVATTLQPLPGSGFF